ncbi:MAG: hypothetical protein VKL41_15480 [Snowella sp.]|nr:hypothetical protein [Snowella sp.]
MGEVVIATGVDIVLGDGTEVSSVFFGVGFSCLLKFLGLLAGKIMDCFGADILFRGIDCFWVIFISFNIFACWSVNHQKPLYKIEQLINRVKDKN